MTSTPNFVARDGVSLNPSGLKLVELLAGQAKTQGSIAVALGISKKKLETMLSRHKGECEERYAWERGHAKIEQRVVDAMLSAGLGEPVLEDEVDANKEPVLDAEGKPKQIWVRTQSKIGGSLLIFYTKAQLGWQEKPSGPLVQDNRINITLPAPMSRGELLAALGQDQILDFRKDKSTPMKDVTPQPLAIEGPKGQ